MLKALAVLGLVCGLSRMAFTQAPQQDRIASIAGSGAVRLEGNRRPLFRPENDLGPVKGSFQLENISLMFKLTESQQAELTALLAEQQDPSSPNYHQWLTPEQYADRFGLSPKDIGKVDAWLQAQGFQVIQTARGRNWVSFSGTAAQVQAAFQTEIHNFSLHGQTYYANATEPAVPAALAEVVLGFRGLDNYRLKPHSLFRHVGASRAGPGPNAVRPYTTDGGEPPNFTSGISGNTFLSPGDIAILYDLNPLYSNGINGAGQTLAIMGQTDLYNGGSDITAFRTAAGLPPNTPTIILDGSDPGLTADDIAEASLDLEWSGAVAPNATILYVNSLDAVSSLYYAIDHNLAPVLSISYAGCEQS
jgi:subtilase family serine protease